MSELAEEIEVHDNQGLEGHLFSDDDCHGIITWSTVYPSAGCWARTLLHSTYSTFVNGASQT